MEKHAIADRITQIWLSTGRREEAEELFQTCFGVQGEPACFSEERGAVRSASVFQLRGGPEICLLDAPDAPPGDWGITALTLEAPAQAGRDMEAAGFLRCGCLRRSDGDEVTFWDHGRVLGLNLGLRTGPEGPAAPKAEGPHCRLEGVRLTFAAREKEPLVTLLRDTYALPDWRYPGTAGFPNADHVECGGITPQLQILKPLNARSGAAKWLSAHGGKRVGVCSLELRSGDPLDELRARFALRQIPTGDIGTHRLAVETVAILGVALVMHAPR